MPNFNDFKTSNLAYFPRPTPGKPAWKLDQPSNAWDDLVDQVAALNRAVVPVDEVSVAPVALTVGAAAGGSLPRST